MFLLLTSTGPVFSLPIRVRIEAIHAYGVNGDRGNAWISFGYQSEIDVVESAHAIDSAIHYAQNHDVPVIVVAQFDDPKEVG